LDGPPGTGKSQTIANIIATQIAEGRRVLFVSEKIAALEVVKNRLDAIGLGSYLLELHSSKAKRSVVAADLGRSLHKHPQASSFFSDTERNGLQRRRESLSAYVDGMNDSSTAIGMSLHDAIGVIAMRANLPEVPGANYPIDNLDSKSVSAVMEAAKRLERAWRPAIEGVDFAWHGVTTQVHPRLELTIATQALQDLQDVVDPYEDISTELGWDGPPAASLIIALLEAASLWDPEANTELLSREDWVELSNDASAFLKVATDLASAELALTSSAGDHWRRLISQPESKNVEQFTERLVELNPNVRLEPTVNATQLAKFLSLANTFASAIERVATRSAELAHALGLISPESLVEVQDVLEVFTRATGRHRPEAAWFKTDVDAEVERAIQALRNAHTSRADAKATASQYFQPSIIVTSPRDLNIRFSNQHTGLKKLSSAYRADRRTVQDACQAGVDVRDAISHLPLAIAWQEAEDTLAAEESKSATLLGSRYRGDETNWNDLEEALENARAIASKARASALEKLAQAAAHGSDVNPANRTVAENLDRALQDARAAMDELAPYVATAQFVNLTLHQQMVWHGSASAELQSMLEIFTTLDTFLERTLALTEVAAIQQDRNAFTKAAIEIEKKQESIQARFPFLPDLNLSTAEKLDS
jgi:hypothetical protein